MSFTQDHHTPVLQRSPFHAHLEARNHRADWAHWNGYLSPRVLDDLSAEYYAIRGGSSVMDLTPMEKYAIRGADALAYLNRLVTRDVSKLAPGRVTYVVWCNDEGKVLDDGTLFNLGNGEYRLCAQHHQLDWLLTSAIGFDVQIRLVTHDIAALSLQGPTACAVLGAMGLEGISAMRPFDCARFELAGLSLEVSRTGFTGDLGYELWTGNASADALWNALFAVTDRYDIRVIGLSALEMVRLEAGFLMPGFDFNTAEATVRADHDRTPFELGLDFVVDLDKPAFTGLRALRRLRQQPLRRKLLRLTVDGNKPCADALVYTRRRGDRVGAIRATCWSPMLKRNLALAEVTLRGGRVPNDLWTEVYHTRELEWVSTWQRCQVWHTPFYQPPQRTATPPPQY